MVAPSVYGHQMIELAADVSASAFSAIRADLWRHSTGHARPVEALYGSRDQ